MRKIGWRAFTIFVFAFIISLLVTAPATLLSRVVESASKGRFLLANASGNFWQGSATPAIRRDSGNLLALEKLHWDIAVLPLFTGKINTRLRWESVEQVQPMTVILSYGQVEVRNAWVPLPASVLGDLTPMLQPAQLSGNILIKSDQFSYSANGINGSAAADWMNAGSVLSAVKPLGSYQLGISGNGQQLELSLKTIAGALVLEGNGSFAQNGGLKFQATARASAESKEGLNELLNNFGPESAPGVHRLNLMSK